MSIPAVFASGMLEFYESLKYVETISLLNLIIATLFSAISGYVSIEYLLKYLRKKSTLIFVIYRILLGIIILILIGNKLLQP